MKFQLLDPLGTLCKLVALNFYEVNTKISIYNNALYLQQPSSYQGLLRTYYSDDRDNIALLYFAIIRVIEWYIVEDNKINLPHNMYQIPNLKKSEHDIFNMSPNKNIFIQEDEFDNNSNYSSDNDNTCKDVDSLSSSPLNITSSRKDGECVLKIDKNQPLDMKYFVKNIIKFSCDGLKKLQKTYKDGNVILSIQFLINILTDSYNNIYDTNKLHHNIFNTDNSKNFLNYEKMKNFWDIKKLESIFNLYKNCYESVDKKNDDINSYLISIFCILDKMDNDFRKIIYECH
jgi:hypothetical protein